METAKRKFIQKRTQRKERFARMARIRYRKERNALIATTRDITKPYTSQSQEGVFEGLLGFNVEETEEGLDNDLCLLNANYFSNTISIVNDKSKLLCVKLHKSPLITKAKNRDRVSDWERRSDPYWKSLAAKGKRFYEGYCEFMVKNMQKFESNNVDDESLKIHQSYSSQRDELMSKKPCLEIRARFNSKEAFCSEVIFNSEFVSRLNYDFEEFIQKILIEGLPRLHPNFLDNKRNDPDLFDFHAQFERAQELKFPVRMFYTRGSNVIKTGFSILSGGYFIKNGAELSRIIVLDDDGTKQQCQNKLNGLYIEQQILNDLERKKFLEMFYSEELEKVLGQPKQASKLRTCLVRSILPPEELEEESDRFNSEERTSDGLDRSMKSEENSSSVCMKKEEMPYNCMQNLPFNQFVDHTLQSQYHFWSLFTQQNF